MRTNVAKVILKNDYIKSAKFECYHKIIKGISADKSIVITNANKDHNALVLDKDDYINKSMALLNDTLTICILKMIYPSQINFPSPLLKIFVAIHVCY